MLITDWSGIAIEFSYCTLKPSIFINTPMKIMNQNYEKYGIEPLEITLRDQIGTSLNVDELVNINDTVVRLLADEDAYKTKIRNFVRENVYHPGRSGEAGGKYILKQLNDRGD